MNYNKENNLFKEKINQSTKQVFVLKVCVPEFWIQDFKV